jgi:heptaprenyl diphosphate synthase
MEDRAIREEIIKVHEGTKRSDIEEIIKLVKNSGAIEKSLYISDKYLQKALEVLEELPPSKSKKALRDIAKFIGKRKF